MFWSPIWIYLALQAKIWRQNSYENEMSVILRFWLTTKATLVYETVPFSLWKICGCPMWIPYTRIFKLFLLSRRFEYFWGYSLREEVSKLSGDLNELTTFLHYIYQSRSLISFRSVPSYKRETRWLLWPSIFLVNEKETFVRYLLVDESNEDLSYRRWTPDQTTRLDEVRISKACTFHL